MGERGTLGDNGSYTADMKLHAKKPKARLLLMPLKHLPLHNNDSSLAVTEHTEGSRDSFDQ
ncbi:Uncharacterized protein DAT39_005495, partial [Clarias magur]